MTSDRRATDDSTSHAPHDERAHLRDAPGFRAGVEWPAPRNTWFWALGDTTFTLHQGADLVMHFDLEGRLRRAFVDGTNYQRGMDGRVLRKVPSRWRGSGAPPTGPFGTEETAALFDAVHRAVSDSLAELRDDEAQAMPGADDALQQARETLERAARFDASRLAAESERFLETYDPLGILPPDCYRSLILQVTTGCRYGKCEFCTLYEDVSWRRKSVDEFHAHLRSVKELFGRALPLKRGVFLSEANALEIPTPDLARMMEIAADELPEIVQTSPERRGGFSAFTDVFEGHHRDDEDLELLARRGLRRVYLGIESGDDVVLRRLLKPANRELVLRRARELREVGLSIGAIFLVGAGGRERSRAHVDNSIALLRDLELDKDDIVYLSRLRPPPSMKSVIEAGVLDEDELAAEEKELLLAAQSLGTRASRYEVDTFVYY